MDPNEGVCEWARTDSERVYHDQEWGVPSRDEAHLFEMLTLEGAQAGLSWSTILNKRDGYRRAFAGFDPKKVAAFTESDIERLVQDASIVRHRGKIESTIGNARALVAMHDSGETLRDLAWSFVDAEPVQNRFRALSDLPAQTETSRALSRALKKRGFRFVGPTTVYAFMQACGLVNDHVVTCPRHDACAALG